MKNFCNPLKWASMLSMAAFITTSCSNQKEKNDIPSSTDRNISIRSVRYVNDEDKGISINQNQSTNGTDKVAASAKKTSIDGMYATAEAPFSIESASEFDFTTDIQSNAIPSLNKAQVSRSGQLKAADVPLPNNKKFRLVFVPDGSNSPIYNAVLNAGQDPDLHVEANKKYFWYAFSVNDPEVVPNIDGSGNIASTDLANKDFMFASGEITTQQDENYLDITFLRQMAAIDVTINTRGMFGGITDNSTFTLGTGTGSSFTNIVQTGTFNIFNATFANFEDTNPVKGSQMRIVDNRWGAAEKIARFYTANTSRTVEANNLRVRLNSLSITLDDNSTRTFSENSIVPIAHSAKLSLSKGTLSKTNVRLIESGVTVDGLVWARTNLIYNANKVYGGSYSAGFSDGYRFRPNNEYARPDINTEYWNFGTATPKGTDFQTVDVCRRVYPEGTWRLPQEFNSPQEITRLSNNTNRSKTRKTVSDGHRFSLIWPNSQAANPAYPDNNLIISAYGYRNNSNGGSIQQIPSGSSSGSGYLLIRSNRYTDNNTSSVLFAQVDNGTFGNTSVPTRAHNEGVPIRCVRNKVNN